jgi:hypothetical protein
MAQRDALALALFLLRSETFQQLIIGCSHRLTRLRHASSRATS